MIAQRIGEQELERLQEGFATYMRGTGKSLATIRIYQWAIQSLRRHLRETDGSVTRESLEAWDRRVLQVMSPKSRAMAWTGVRQFLNWAADQDQIDYKLAHSVPTIKYDRLPLQNALTPNALMKIEYYLQTQAEEDPKSVRRLRDRALYFYVKSTAARVSEILQVRRKHFKRQVVRQKGGGPKELIPPPGVANLVHQYLRARVDDNEYLWIGWHGDNFAHPHRLTDDGVLRLWERVARKVGVPPFRTQDLRNTAAILLVERQHDDLEIMEFLGNRDFRSLQRYKQAAADKLARLRADLDVPY